MPKTKISQPSAPAPAERLACLDAYRGFVILAMIWVNYIGEMPGIPAWLKHATASQDTFTIPDLVFPGFLFMVGISIPLALGRRIQDGAPLLPILTRIFWRSLGLILAGLMMVNDDRYDAKNALLSSAWYFSLFYLSIILIWKQEKQRGWTFWLGAALFAFLMLAFKGKLEDGASSVWLDHQWWGILGLIGWSYLACSLLYLAARGSAVALMGCFAFMIAVTMGSRVGRLDFVAEPINNFIGLEGLFGSTSANVMAGVLVGLAFQKAPLNLAADPAARRLVHLGRLKFMFFFALGLLFAGLLLRPYHGISKINATESFTLVTAAVNLFMFLIFYIFMDLLQWRAWAALFIPAGSNALLAYILPDLWNQFTGLIGIGPLWWHYGWYWLEKGGMAGILNAAAVSLFMLGLTVLGSRAGLKLKF